MKVNALKGRAPCGTQILESWDSEEGQRLKRGGLAHTNADPNHRYDVTDHRLFPNVGMKSEVEFDGKTYKRRLKSNLMED